jgi:hypothetical protein
MCLFVNNLRKVVISKINILKPTGDYMRLLRTSLFSDVMQCGLVVTDVSETEAKALNHVCAPPNCF